MNSTELCPYVASNIIVIKEVVDMSDDHMMNAIWSS